MNIERITVDTIANIGATQGFWALYRTDSVGGTRLARMLRGFTPDIFDTINAAAEIALNEEASHGRWSAIAKFRKLTRSVQ